MGVLTLMPLNGAGIDIRDFDIRDIAEYEEAMISPTMANFYDYSSNYTRFLGAGITYVATAEGELLDVTGGVVDELIVAVNGLQYFNFTGLRLSAVTIFDFYQAGNAQGARDYFLSGTDTIHGTNYADILYSGADDDTLNGGSGNDELHGESGNDTLNGGAGIDNLFGGSGNDTYGLGADNDTVSDTSGIDTVTSTISRSLTAFTGVENLTLLGSANLEGYGNELANVIIGNSGNNVLSGRGGIDTLNGGAGNDTYVLSGDNDIIIDVSGNDTVTSTAARSLAGYAMIERLTLLGSADINGTGNALNNVIKGNTGNNILDGGAGADGLDGGAGNDTYVLADGNDSVVDISGNDTITTTITRTLEKYATIERLTLLGTANINGTGNALNNVIKGNSGNNVLDGGAGADGLDGGAGNDTYVLADGNDSVVDSAGTDTITSTISRSLADYATIEKLTLLGSASINGTGNALNNVIKGNAGNNVLDGGAGADGLDGGAGDDTYVLADGNDSVTDSAGIDTIASTITRTLEKYATVEKLTLLGMGDINGIGNALNNTIRGNSGDNRLDGGNGDDGLIAGAGNDTLTGGSGADTFVFNTALNASTNVDTITDFNTIDTIQLDNAVFTRFASIGGISSSMFVSNSTGTAHDANDYLVYNSVNGNLYYDADGSGAGAAVLFAKLSNQATLTHQDFLII